MPIRNGQTYIAPLIKTKVHYEHIEGRWYAFCDTHSNCQEFTKTNVEVFVLMPWGWCSECQHLLEGLHPYSEDRCEREEQCASL